MAGQPIRITILIGLMLGTLAGVKAAGRYKQLQIQGVRWEQVPLQLGPWEGEEARLDPVFGFDPADTSLIRVYTRENASPITVYAGFQKDMTATLEVHTPKLCYPSQGWEVASEEKVTVGEFHGRWVQAREIVVSKQGESRLVLWWYYAESRPFENRIRHVYRIMVTALFTGRTDGGIVRVEIPIVEGGEPLAHQRLMEFARLFWPALEKGLPQ